MKKTENFLIHVRDIIANRSISAGSRKGAGAISDDHTERKRGNQS